MNLHLLRIFFTVSRERSFSRAADLLYISQPAVSKGVRELEHQLDLALVERAQRGGGRQSGVLLTPIGEVLYEHARGIFALEKAAIDDIHARAGLRRGALVIGASTTIAGYWLGPYLATFSADYPELDIEVRTGNTEAVSHWLVDCQVDVALVEGEVTDARLRSHHWCDDPLVVIAPADWTIRQQSEPADMDLSGYRWIVREPGSGTREATGRLLQQLGVQPERQLEAGSNEAITRAVASSVGLAMVPRVVADDLIALGRVQLVAVSEAVSLSRPLYTLEYENRRLSPAAREFSECLRRSAPES